MLDQELEVSVRARRQTCVVDPMLALASPHGAQFVLRLSAVADLWVVRTFWQVLDASEYYRRDPLALWPAPQREALDAQTAAAVRQALTIWENARARTDMANCRMHWVSDNLSESAFPEGTLPDLIERYEALHQAMAAHGDPGEESTESAGFFGAMDALSLAAALGSARLLSLAPDDARCCLAAAFRHVGVGMEPAPGERTDLVALERAQLRELLVNAGAAPLIWGGLRVAAAQLLLPEECPAVAEPGGLGEHAGDAEEDFEFAQGRAATTFPADPWRSARVFWYPV